jgi:iron complex transport system ATP-binding protein
VITAGPLLFEFGTTPVLRGAELVVPDGATVGLVGPNGSGKSTILRCITGALEPHGAVLIDDIAVHSISDRARAQQLAVVGQDAPTALALCVRDLVMLGRSPHRSDLARFDTRDATVVDDVLERVGVSHLATRPIRELSGGERQRVLIARALAQQAPYLLLDEPTNHLDVRYAHELLGLVASLPVTTVVVLHDLNLAARFCSTIAVLDNGRVVATGTPHEVLTPDILMPIYGITVRRIELDGHLHLCFGTP